MTPPPAFYSIPSELHFEILTRLPGKSVARFKCVCKDWLATIRSARFRKAYRSRNRILLINWSEEIAREEDQEFDPDRRLRFFYSPLRRLNEPPPPPDFCPLHELLFRSDYDGTTQPINGLVCHGNLQPNAHFEMRSWLQNVFTGEEKKIPGPPYIALTASTYHLGIDSMTGEYKILRLAFRLDHHQEEVVNRPLKAQTIVLGRSDSDPDSFWRTIECEDSGLAGLSLMSKAVYQMASHCEVRTFSDGGVVCWFRQKVGLVLFDFHLERFWMVRPPEGLHHKDRVFLRAGFNGHRSVAMYVLPKDGKKAACFILDDYDCQVWRKEEVEFPADIMKTGFGVADGDLMLLLMMGNQESKSKIVYGYGDDKSVERFWAGNLPGDAAPLDLKVRGPSMDVSLNWGFNARLSCLHDSSVMYRSIDDVLAGKREIDDENPPFLNVDTFWH